MNETYQVAKKVLKLFSDGKIWREQVFQVRSCQFREQISIHIPFPSSLIYNNKQGISSANDLIQIMNIGNQLYSSLSQLARHSYLMETITYNVECVWYKLSTRIRWKLHWYCRSRDCNRQIYYINTSEIPSELSRENSISSHVKRSPSLWLHNKSRLWKQADWVFHWCLHNKQHITYSLTDMNFIFSCSTRYLTSEHSEWVRYRVDHSKIKFISMRGHVISSISVLYLINSLWITIISKLHKFYIILYIILSDVLVFLSIVNH